MPLAALVVGGIAGSLGGAAIASSGANKAANTQANAELAAAQLQNQLGEDQLGFEKGVYGNQEAEIAPFLNASYPALANLAYLSGTLPPGAPGTGTQSGPPIAYQPGTNGGGQTQADPLARYNGRTFQDLVSSGDPSVSPNQQTTNEWQQAGIPFTNIQTSDGRTVAVRTPTASSAPPASPSQSGINIPNNLAMLANPSLGAPGSLLAPFVAPTDVTEQNDPGYQFRLNQGLQQLSNSAAARGGLLSGGTEKALQDFAQNDASNEYGNAYNRAFNTFETNQANTWNRLAALAGIGQTATAQLGAAGNAAVNSTAGTTASLGSQVGNSIGAAGSARATGYLNSGNIFGNAISGSTNNLLQLYMLAGMGGGGGVGLPQDNGSLGADMG